MNSTIEAPEFTSPDAQIERIRQTVSSMQRRIRALDSLLEEQIRTLDLEHELFRPQGFIINRRTLRVLQIAGITAALLSFASGFLAGYQRLGSGQP
jgi:hypothetical protein